MRVLFIGGTGIISSACTRLLAEQGIDLTLLCRGKTTREVPKSVRILQADLRQPGSVQNAIAGQQFDAVVDWIAFTPDQIEADIALFSGKTRQFVFISSASAYHTPPRSLPVTESTPLYNPFWAYSRAKIACEERLLRAYRDGGFPITIVRPSHTYDCTLLPPHGGWTVIERMRKGKPVVVHGDGTSLWTLTHHRDFARAFNGLLGLDAAISETFHITSDEVLTWDQIHHILARAAGTQARIVHVPSDFIARHDREWGDSLLGDKTHSMVFDNTKIKRFVPSYGAAEIPFSRGAEEIVAYHDADPARRVIDEKSDAMVEQLLNEYQRAFGGSSAAQ
jgi:nucleoside-diphosphate-sugar epimerase